MIRSDSPSNDFMVTSAIKRFGLKRTISRWTAANLLKCLFYFLINCRHLKSRFPDRFHEECEFETLDLGRSMIGVSWFEHGESHHVGYTVFGHIEPCWTVRTEHIQALHMYMCASPACARVIIEYSKLPT